MKEVEISLNNLSFFGYHGVLKEERKLGNEFKVDLSVSIPFNEGMKEDNLESTISYADLYEIVREEMQRPKKLLEKIAIDIIERIQENFAFVTGGYIRIEKVRPPIPEMLGSASVTLKF